MIRKYYFLFLFLLLPIIVVAQQRNEGDAISVAQEFWGNKHNKLKVVPRANIVQAQARINSNNASVTTHPGYYIINDDVNKRFVIVSGDERLYKILGYSDNGVFDTEKAPIGLLEMLSEYDNQYQSVAPHLDEIGYAGTRSTTTVVEPLIKTKWDQGSPFNDDCPIDITGNKRSTTGCVATAMAQVMNYYKHPNNGIGKNSYISTQRNIYQNMDFSTVYPDWGNMLDSYDDNATETQKKAVAQLMHACGVSVSMDYTSGESGAYAIDMAYALSHFWKYNQNISYKQRKYYSEKEWNQIILQDLSEGHPILYSGQGTGGHQFVLDGCDSEGLYHFNFGWGGNCDGNYSLDILTPSYKIFGYEIPSGHDFSSNQDMVCNIAPETYGQYSGEFYVFGSLGLSNAKVGGSDTVKFGMANFVHCSNRISNGHTFTGKYGVGLFDKDYNFVYSLSSRNVSSLNGGLLYTMSYILKFDATVFKEDSQYYLACYAYSDDFGYCIAKTEKGQEDYYLATVKDGMITFEPMKKMDDTGTVANEVVTGLYNASSSGVTEGTITWQTELWQDEQDKTKYWIANLDPIAKKNGYTYNKGWNKVYGFVSNTGNRIDIPVNQIVGKNLLLHNYTGGDNIVLYLNADAKTMSIEDVWGSVEQDYSSENASTKDYSRYSGARFTYTTVRDEDPIDAEVSAPLINVSDSHVMTLRSNTEDASVYYTLDGSQPSSSSILYSQPVELTGNCTIKAIAIKDNFMSSVVTYTVSDFVCLEPIISQSEGGNTVTITCGTTNAEIYYTLDGTTPSRNAQRYTGNFDIEKSCIVKAIAVKQYYNDSPVTSKSAIYHQSGELEEQELRIENNKAGDLANRVAEADKTSVQRWYISGKINGTDIRYLKEALELGNITDLDLSNVFIVSGGEAYYKSSVNEYYTEDNVVGKYMFEDAKSLISLRLPETTTKIEGFSLEGCDNLASIIIPDLCTELESFAISGCKHISSIHLGKSMELFEDYNCNRCPLLTSITVSTENSHFKSENGVLFDARMSTLVKYPCGKNEREYAIPSSVKTIDAQAFNGAALENVIMPEGLEVIGHGAFEDCKNLLSADMPQSTNTIEGSAFSNCAKLTNVSIPDKVTSVKSFCFAYCVNLRNVHIGNNVKEIDNYAFSHATSLQAFSVSDDNTNFTVNEGILYSKDRTSLVRCPLALYSDEMILDNDIVSIESHAFANCTYIKKFRLPAGLKKIGRYAFEHCSMEGISIPASVEIIDDNAFANCKNLKSFIIPEILTEIPSFMLSHCDSLEYVYIPADITNLGSYAFSNDKKLRTIECAITDISKVEVPLNYSGNEYTTFQGINPDCFWHVPAGCADAYTSQPWWKPTWKIIDDVISGIGQAKQDDELTVTTGPGSLTIQSCSDKSVIIYDTNGMIIRKINLTPGKSECISLPSGICIINGHKYYVK